MKNYSGTSTSLWNDGFEVISADGQLKTDISVDICVIGAGISGLTTAYLLSKAGRKVVVLEKNEIGSGMTSRTTAHIVIALDDRYYKLEALHGEKGAALAGESHRAAINEIEKIIEEEKIECEFERVNGYLFSDPEHSQEELNIEFEAALRAGCEVELLDKSPLPSFDTGTALRFSNQAQFHPMKYLAGLANAIRANGGKIFTHTNVVKINSDNEPSAETSDGITIHAAKMVISTNSPINNNMEIPLKQSGYMTYVVGARIPRDSVPKALFWDNLKNYHYIRIAGYSDMSEDDQILLIGGEDHKVGQANDGEQRYRALEEWAAARFPMIKKFDYHWSGEVFEPIDSLAFIGKNDDKNDNIYISTGDSGNGITHGTIAGILLTDLILGRSNDWSELYTPSRKVMASLFNFATEALNSSAQYLDWLAPNQVHSKDDILPREGAVVWNGMEKIAVYRDEENQLHEFSAACPHLSGVVRWNSSEKTWDCPCHGSRFDALGNVIEGPAIRNLDPVSRSKPQE